MPNVIKRGGLAVSDQVVKIPDLPRKRVSSPVHDEEGGVSFDPSDTEQMVMESAIKSAEARTREIVSRAEEQRSQILMQAGTEAEQIRQQARQQGYSDGYSEMCGQISGCIAQIGQTLDQMRAHQQEFIHQYEQNLRLLSVDIAEKILNKRIADDGTDLLELVRQAVSSIKNAEWIEVEVSDKLPALVERLQTEFAVQAGGPQVDVVVRDLPPGGCIVHTPEAIVDASVPVQLANLREIFADID